MAKKYRPPVIKSTSSFGETTIARVRLGKSSSGKKLVQVLEKGEKKPIVVKEFPDYVKQGTFMVQLSEDKDKLLAMRPVNGMFTFKTVRFAAAEGEDPEPKSRTGRGEHGEYTIVYWVVLLEITSEKYKGMPVPMSLNYHFGEIEAEDGKMVVGITKPKSKYTQLLLDYLDATEIWDFGPMKPSDNVLPALEKRVLRKDKEFSAVMKDGWITTIFAMDETEDIPWEEELPE